MPKQRSLLWVLVGWLMLLAADGVYAQTFPPLSGRVVDAANIIPSELEASLTARLEALETASTRQFVVATVADLEGYDISEYGYKLGDHWGIGQKGANEGIILLVAPNERKVRIEIGYGLEPVVPDVLASRIIRNEIVPRFKAGDVPGGIDAGANAVIALVSLPPGEAAQQAKVLEDQPEEQTSIIGVLFWLFIFFFVLLPILRRLFGKRGRRFGDGPVIIWGPGDWGGSSSSGSSWDGGGFSGGGGEFGGGGASGDW